MGQDLCGCDLVFGCCWILSELQELWLLHGGVLVIHTSSSFRASSSGADSSCALMSPISTSISFIVRTVDSTLARVLFTTRRARAAYRRVLMVSSYACAEGLTVAIIMVLLLPLEKQTVGNGNAPSPSGNSKV